MQPLMHVFAFVSAEQRCPEEFLIEL